MRPIEPVQQEPLIKMLAMQKQGRAGNPTGLVNLDETAQYLQGPGGMPSQVAPDDGGGAMMSQVQPGANQLAGILNRKGRGMAGGGGASSNIRAMQQSGGGMRYDCSSGTCRLVPMQGTMSTVTTTDGATPQSSSPTTVQGSTPAQSPNQAAAPAKSGGVPPLPGYAQGDEYAEFLHRGATQNQNRVEEVNRGIQSGATEPYMQTQPAAKNVAYEEALAKHLGEMPQTEEAKSLLASKVSSAKSVARANKVAAATSEFYSPQNLRKELNDLHTLSGTAEGLTPDRAISRAISLRAAQLKQSGYFDGLQSAEKMQALDEVRARQTGIIMGNFIADRFVSGMTDMSGADTYLKNKAAVEAGTMTKEEFNKTMMNDSIHLLDELKGQYAEIVDAEGKPLSSLDLKNKMMVDLAPDIGDRILEKWKQAPGYDPEQYEFYKNESMKLARRTVTSAWGMIEGERRKGNTQNSIAEAFTSWTNNLFSKGIPTEAFTGEQAKEGEE